MRVTRLGAIWRDRMSTIARFRSVRAVANAVLTYSADIVGWFESEALEQAAGSDDEAPGDDERA